MNDLSKDAVNRLAVDAAGAGQRVDNFLLRLLKGVPTSHVYRILRSGEVRVNRKRVKPDTRLVVGDEVRVPPIRTSAPKAAAGVAIARGPVVPVLYEDEELIALNKPSGLAVHGGSGVSFGVIEQIRAQRPQAKFLELVHRLDRDTSGVLLLAKTRAALVGLHRTLREGQADKRYLVLVKGRWRDAKRSVELPLTKGVASSGETRVRVDDLGKASRTVFYRREVWAGAVPPMSLLEAELHTGRTHQIRVHLSHLQFPVAGDDKYGDFGWNKVLAAQGLKRMFLHANRLVVEHPSSAKRLELEADLPPELSNFLARIARSVANDG